MAVITNIEQFLRRASPNAPSWFADPPEHILSPDKAVGGHVVSAWPAAGNTAGLLAHLCGQLAHTSSGSRNALLNKHAYTLGGHIAAGTLDRGEVERALFLACEMNGLVKEGAREVRATIKSGIEGGMKKPFAAPAAEYTFHDEEDGEEAPVFLCEPGSLEDLTHPPGLVGAIIDWCEQTAERPSRAVALGAALGFVAALAGRKFKSPTNLRTNLYITTLAESGFGKDHPRQALKHLAQAAGLERFIGPARVMSSRALRNEVANRPSQVLLMDEIHGTIAMIGDRRSMHGQLLGDDLLTMFASASTWFEGAAHAAEPATCIHNPNLCIYGTSTPDAFWGAAGVGMTTNGLFARFILLNIEEPKGPRASPRGALDRPPLELVQQCQSLAHSRGNIFRDGNSPAKATLVTFDDDAEAIFGAFTAEVDARAEAAATEFRPLLNRAREHAIKLALTVAAGVAPEAPIITAPILEWAQRLAWRSTCTILREAQDRIASNIREANYQRILMLLKKEPHGMSEGKLIDKLRGVDKRQRAELLEDLSAAGRIRKAEIQTKKGMRERWVFLR